MSDKTLSAGELLDVTGTPQVERQKAVLRGWGIDPKQRADKSLMVTWAAIHQAQELREAENLADHGISKDNPLVRMVISNDPTSSQSQK